MLPQEESKKASKKRYNYTLAVLVSILIIGIYASSFYNYLLFHTLAELFSISIALGIFMIAWNSRKYMEDSFFLIIGVSSLFIGIIDLLHTLAYTGMNIFIGYTSNLPASLWIAARYLQACSILMAILIRDRSINTSYLAIGYGITFSILVFVIFFNFFPVCYIEGKGLTPFKIVSEYVIISIFAVCLALIYKNRSHFNKRTWLFILLFILVSMSSEFAFTLYIGVYDFPNLVGHLLKIVAFFFIYRGIIVVGLEDPYNSIFKRLKDSEQELVKNADALTHAYAETEQIFNASLPLRLIDIDFNIVRVNDTFCDLFEVKADEVLGKRCYDVFPLEFCNTSKCTMKQIKNHRTKIEYEANYTLKNGRQLTLLVNSVPKKDTKGDLVGLIHNYTDITERKTIETQLNESEEKFRLTFQNAADAIFWANADTGIILNCNKTSELLVDRPKDKIIGQHQSFLHPPDTVELYKNMFSDLAKRRGILNEEAEIITSSGKIIPVQITASYTIINNIPIIQGIFHDIRERKKAERRLKQLISTISHELRTPITVLLMSLDFLRQEGEKITPDVERKLLDGIFRNVELLHNLANDILEVAKLDEQQIELEWIEYNPLEVINDILTLMTPIGNEKGISFVVNVDKNFNLKGDPKRIDQIFRILIDNAIKYSKSNSTIKIEAIENYKGKFNPKNINGVLFEFKDNGIGIRRDEIPHLFERFFRSSTVSEIPGTGLGLAIAKDLTQLHQGDIYVESEFGKGSTFSVFFPYL